MFVMIPVILVLFIVINSSMGFIVMKHNHNVNQTMTQADIDQIRAEQAAEAAERAEIYVFSNSELEQSFSKF